MRTAVNGKVLMIYTGGTIGMIENSQTGALEPFNFDHVLQNVPKLKMLNFTVDPYAFSRPVDSSEMTPQHWCDIAKVIEEKYDSYDGFVVLHGTDTMAYTASALSYMLENLAKPVIITGSQLPIGEVRTDGEENLITALHIAATKDKDGKPMVREVAILFDDYLWRGNRSTKHSSDNFNAFQSNNYPPLARIGLSIIFNREALLRRDEDKPLKVNYNMDCSVSYLNLFPGINENIVSHLLHAPGLKGVVLKTFGAGNGPNYPWFIKAISEAVNRGIVIVNVTQCSNGSVMPNLYANGQELAKRGIVAANDMTSEAAVTKLMYLFGKGMNSREVADTMQKSICGEITVED